MPEHVGFAKLEQASEIGVFSNGAIVRGDIYLVVRSFHRQIVIFNLPLCSSVA